jgi:hypothetical protein
MGTKIHSGSISSIYAYFLVTGIITIKETFPFAVGLSIRRKDYMLGSIVTAALVSTESALLLVLLRAIEIATNGWGGFMDYFSIQFLNGYTWMSHIGIFGIVLLHNYFLGFVIACIHRRFGRSGMFSFFSIMLALGIVGTYLCSHFGLWNVLGMWIVRHYMELFWWMVPAVAVYMGASYLLLRKAAA